MSSILLDTNILIYLLQGNTEIRSILENKIWIISFISEIELKMKDGMSSSEIKAVNALLNECFIIEMNNAIKERAIKNAKKYKLKLADSIILATAQEYEVAMITADKVFRKPAEASNDLFLFVP
jgi:predicted nucleic acid-binding protein